MTRLPSLDVYNEAVQDPARAFTDRELARGAVVRNGLGLPKPASGGFALTYALESGGKTYAVRLFHRHSAGLEARYKQISMELARSKSPYFVEFEFQPLGIAVRGTQFPVVKMAWAAGEVLSVWVRRHRSSKTSMLALRDQFRTLSSYLESRGIAHGDIQGGNVMVDVGPSVRLIDYDGMWVPTMATGNGEELGHIHFQHPRRERGSFGPAIDRFSFIVLDLTLSALAENPKLLDDFNTGENLVLQQSDYSAPHQSKALLAISQLPALKQQAEHFARICLAPIDQVPSLGEFLQGVSIPTPSNAPAPLSPAAATAYRGQYAVLDASDYGAAARLVGDRVELIGRVEVVKVDFDRNLQRYAFVNFGDWRGCAVKLQIWSNALASFPHAPDQSWKGRWISVIGLVQAPFETKDGYDHIGIEIEDASEIRFISEAQAQFRLGKPRVSAGTPQPAASQSSNRALLEEMLLNPGTATQPLPKPQTPTVLPPVATGSGAAPGSNLKPSPPLIEATSPSSNQELLAQMRAMNQRGGPGAGSISVPSSAVPTQSNPLPQTSPSSSSNTGAGASNHRGVSGNGAPNAPGTSLVPAFAGWVGGVFALIGIAKMPYGYYGLMRIVIVLACVTLVVNAIRRGVWIAALPLILCALVFLFVRGISREAWAVIDFLSAVGLIGIGVWLSRLPRTRA